MLKTIVKKKNRLNSTELIFILQNYAKLKLVKVT